MLKTHFLQNKEVTIAGMIALGVLFVLLINAAVILPTAYNVFMKHREKSVIQSVDTQTVDEALELLSSP